MAQVFWLFDKELRDVTRDRRTLLSGFAYASLGPLVLWMLLAALAREQTIDHKIYKVCEGNAPGLLAHLSNEGFTLTDDARVCLRIDADYQQDFVAGLPAGVTIVSHGSGTDMTVERLRHSIHSYNQRVSSQRLLARGIASSVLQPIHVATERRGAAGRGAFMLSTIVIPFFVMAAFLSSMSSAIDTTAGERERRSMETLLTLPAARWRIVLAKWLATALIGIVGTLFTVIIGFVVLRFAPLPDLGSRLFIDAGSAVSVILLLVPLTLLVSAVQLLIGFSARTYKEGTSYLTLLSFLPMVAAFSVLRSSEPAVGGLPIPVFWEVAALRGPLLGAAAPGSEILLGMMIEAVLCIGCLMACAMRLRDSRVLSTA